MDRMKTILANTKQADVSPVQVIPNNIHGFQQTFLEGMSKLGNVIHEGFDEIAELDKTLRDGFSYLSDRIDRVNDNLADSVRNRGGSDHLMRFLPAISTDLKEMIEKIEEHGDMIAGKLTTNKEVANLQELQEQQTVERLLSAVLSVASSIEVGQEKVAGVLATGQHQVADQIDKSRENLVAALSSGHSLLAEGQNKISETLTVGHNKLAETNADIASAINTGDEGIKTAISQTDNSLDLIKSSLDVQSERIQSGLGRLTDSLEEAGLTNKEGLADISLRLQQSGEIIKTAGEENQAGLESLGTSLETVGLTMAELKDSLTTSSADTKTVLESIATNLGQTASSSGLVVDSLGRLGQDNKDGLEKLWAALREFQTHQTTHTNRLISALGDLKAGTDFNSHELTTKLHEVAAAIMKAKTRELQQKSVRRLADKIECTTDCFTSEAQSRAIIEGRFQQKYGIFQSLFFVFVDLLNMPMPYIFLKPNLRVSM